ncbi:MAG: glutamate-5-semialdehyde dehydrogenase [Alphaproteobacteria bacterium]|nr:MAG: glutamate-5-semialdehyde dehydrogenase [Caulobacteraceae bacterium]TPW06097.1 MAG: glutamate-5-semialdehyde dehydrogenase [Alphaproteobacteria bacterium]
MTLEEIMHDIGRRARHAAALVREADAKTRTAALSAMAEHLRVSALYILDENAEDVAEAKANGVGAAFVDRLALNPQRLEAVAAGLDEIAAIPDPVGAEMARWTRPNGLDIARVRTPIGVIGVIFESRPNVAADAGALALRAGNATILRGGSDSARTVTQIGIALRAGLREAGLPEDAIQIVPTSDRAAVGMMLKGLNGAIDVIVPRGGKSLVARVQDEARVPVFAHLEGICHTYIHAGADPAKAVAITVNAKMRRVSVCGATETLLIDRAVAPSLLPKIADALRAAGCALRGDEAARAITPMDAAAEEDWRTEYLDAVLSVRVVDGIDQAIDHIARYGTSHTEAIITEDLAAAETFTKRVDSAIVLVNASTQFADGGEFGFGGEIGIATGRLHARGPVGAEQLTTFKYIVRGDGQIRP